MLQSRAWRHFQMRLAILLLCATTTPRTIKAFMSNPTDQSSHLSTLGNLIPMPVSVQPGGATFTLASDTKIMIEATNDELMKIGRYLSDKLKPATGYELPVVAAAESAASKNIVLTTTGGDSTLGDEGYELTVSPDGVKISAHQPAGLFRGIQTLRQLFSPEIERTTPQSAPWTIPTGVIRDYPRFVWRGTMLDVSRHFFKVDDVKRYIDLLAYYKLNRFHLHLSDDQGWRIVINSWPKLATYGGGTEVGGGVGGYYTQAEYSDIVAYAQDRYMMVIPEIDTPGHTNAALASYAELNCNDIAPARYTETKVGFSTLCANKEMTYTFMDDVIRELAAITPGPYIHIGGDEAASTSHEDYIKFIERVQTIVQSHGKQMIGWGEIAKTHLLPTSIAQHWTNDGAHQAAEQGAKIIMSPATKTYLDMKYHPGSPLGLSWAAYIEVKDGYDWEPTTQTPGITEKDILGVEAPLWTETILTMQDIEFMTFPRILGYAEIGWSPMTGRNWAEYSARLAIHGQYLTALNVNFYRSPQVAWLP